MSKADETAKKTAIVKDRYGKTTGASKGYQKPPKPKVKAYPTRDGFKGKVVVKW